MSKPRKSKWDIFFYDNEWGKIGVYTKSESVTFENVALCTIQALTNHFIENFPDDTDKLNNLKEALVSLAVRAEAAALQRK